MNVPSPTFSRRLLTPALVATALALGACGGGDDPSAESASTPATAPAQTSPPASAATTPPTAAAPTSPASQAPSTTPPTSSAESGGGAPADAPSPAGVTPDAASTKRQRPRSLSERIAADSTAKLNVRTMVSIIEGCHSGRETYKACNTHKELGSRALLGLDIGKRRGDVQISATDNGFRITGHSMSGGKFTVARGPNGDRFKCISGPMPGACPPDRTWTW